MWSLPLGAFIKPSQEKAACGGQRAFCMCHACLLKAKSNVPLKPMLAHNGGSNKEAVSVGAGTIYFLNQHAVHPSVLKEFDFFAASYPSYFLLLPACIEHVPKI